MPNPASVEKQQGLNQLVINKVQRMVEGKRQGVMETIARLLDEGKIAQDFIAPIGVNLRGKEKQPVISFRAADRVQMTMPEGNFSLHGNAISQISEKMGVPAKYLRELSGGDVWQKQLCATILNEHSGWTARMCQTGFQFVACIKSHDIIFLEVKHVGRDTGVSFRLWNCAICCFRPERGMFRLARYSSSLIFRIVGMPVVVRMGFTNHPSLKSSGSRLSCWMTSPTHPCMSMLQTVIRQQVRLMSSATR